MRLIRSNDFYQVKVRGYVTPLHLEVLDILYQPILGFAATSLYRYLYFTREFRKGDPLSFNLIYEHFGFTYDQISIAFSKLEGLGLMRSFFVERKEFNEYILELYAPKDPAAFSKDEIYMNLLNRVLGPRHTQDLLSIFGLDRETLNKEEVTASFAAIYGDKIFDIKEDELYKGEQLQNVVSNVKIDFDRGAFINLLTRKRGILPNVLSEEELKKAEEVSAIYGLNEEETAERVGDYYDGRKKKGTRVDFEAMHKFLQEAIKYPALAPKSRRLVQKLTGESQKIKLINMMEAMSSVDFLIYLNEGTKIAPADLKILNLLASDYNLSSAVINALVYYTLYHNNNELIRALMEKNASLLARNKVITALDALDTLERPMQSKATRAPRKGPILNDKKKEKQPKSKAKDDELDAIWKELEKL